MSAAHIEPWVDDALCAEVGGDLWFPEHGSDISVSEAKAICRRCPVVAECLEHALRNDIRLGVWGNASPAERRRMKKRAAS